jgi:hypothetical protein
MRNGVCGHDRAPLQESTVMRYLLRSGGLAMLLLASFSLHAQSAYVDVEKRLTEEQLRATGLDTLSAEQLALLNALLRDSETTRIAEVEEAAKEHAIVATRAEIAREQPVSLEKRTGNGFVGYNDEPIRSRVKADISGWEPGYVFELENGQQWKVLKGKMTLPKTLKSPEILIVPGIAGRWFLQVSEDLAKARVYRID